MANRYRKQAKTTRPRRGTDIDMLIVHSTEGEAYGDLTWLLGLNGVSSDFYIAPNGDIYDMDEDETASAQAGECIWEDQINPKAVINGWGWANMVSEGIEVSGIAAKRKFTPQQYNSLLALARERIAKHKIPASRVVRHSDVAYPKGRKTDPAQLDWRQFLRDLFPDHLAIDAEPRCSYRAFADLLTRRKSPALPMAQTLWNRCLEAGVDPAVALAFFDHESKCGTAFSTAEIAANHNWGNLRTGMGRQLAYVGGFARYATWEDSLLDWIERLHKVYWDMKGLDTVERIIPTYAPSRDRNNPNAYIAAVQATVKALQAASEGYAIDGKESTRELFNFYYANNGLFMLGKAVLPAYKWEDDDGEDCWWMEFENGIVKHKASLPAPYNVRPIFLREAAERMGSEI